MWWKKPQRIPTMSSCIKQTEQNMVFISTWAYMASSSLETKHIYIACTSDIILMKFEEKKCENVRLIKHRMIVVLT